MPIVEWNYNFLLGIQEIDQHHKHLVALLNRTHDDFVQKRDVAHLGPVIDELISYSQYHFECEERWMAETSYPEIASHKEEHEIFRKRVLEFKASYQQNVTFSVEILSFLGNWITHHILETDIKFGHFVDVQNIRNRIHKKSAGLTVPEK
jgi:hemerythrin